MSGCRVELPLPVSNQRLGLPAFDVADFERETATYLAFYRTGLVETKAHMAQLVAAFKDQFPRPWTLYLVTHNKNGLPQLAWRHAHNNAKVRLNHPLSQAYLETISRSAQVLIYRYEEHRLGLNAQAKLIFELQEFCRKTIPHLDARRLGPVPLENPTS